jgi:hypothetical protein
MSRRPLTLALTALAAGCNLGPHTHAPHTSLFAGAYKTVPGEPVRTHSTCAFIDGEIRFFKDPPQLPTTCFSGFNLSDSCDAVEGFERVPRCTEICSRKMTINGVNGQKLRLLQGSSCVTRNQVGDCPRL